MRILFNFFVFALTTQFTLPMMASANEGATVKGKVVFDEERLESWDQQELVIPFEEITSRLFERVDVPPVPFPTDWEKLEPEARQKWAVEFEASDAGKAYIAERDKIIDAARAFDVKIEKNGQFVVFDVPPGVYGLQGRVDKEIGGTKYGFEVFGQIEILKDVDEVVLDQVQVEVTPLLETNQTAPPISVKTHNDTTTLTLDNFKDKYLFVSFWVTNSPSAGYQEDIQKMYAELKDKHPLRLLSICVDDDRKEALKFIIEKKLKEGSHGFTAGFNHRTIFDYGVRSIPSFWLISPDGKISMSQFDFAQSFRAGEQDLGVIISNRILGKDIPTPAGEQQPGEAKSDETKSGEATTVDAADKKAG